MNSDLEHTDIREFIYSLSDEEYSKWVKNFRNQDIYYEGFVCKIEEEYNDGHYDSPYCGCIYLNGENLGLYARGMSFYTYAKDFWKLVMGYISDNKLSTETD